ncbi:hypothetical protein HPB47_015387, partial [Ixodes persulcatus]
LDFVNVYDRDLPYLEKWFDFENSPFKSLAELYLGKGAPSMSILMNALQACLTALWPPYMVEAEAIQDFDTVIRATATAAATGALVNIGTSAFTKRKSSKKCLPAESEQPANTPCGSSNGGSRAPASVKKRLVAASRMPRLPKEHFRVIVRLGQVKIAQALVTAACLSFTNAAEDIICPNAMQNILVVSTLSENNAKTYAGVEAISIDSANYDVSSYLAAPDNT